MCNESPLAQIRYRAEMNTSAAIQTVSAIMSPIGRQRQKWSRGQVEARLANLPPCRIGREACVGAHHLSRTLKALGHDARLMPAKYVRPYSKGQKNDYRDAEAIAEAVQRPTMKFVATKTTDQLDLQALHRVRERFVGQRTGIINQIRAFMLERGIAVRQGLRFLRAELPGILATRTDALSPRMLGYPALEAAGELQPNRLKDSDVGAGQDTANC
jgi:transposase